MKKIFIIMMLSVSLFSAESKKTNKKIRNKGLNAKEKNIVKK